MRLALIAAVLAQVGVAHADSSVRVMLNQQGQDLAADLGLSVPELVAHAESRIDELYRLSRLDQLLRAFANTAVFAQRGLGADYDVDPGDVMVGGAGAGIHGDVAIGTTNALLGGSIVNFAILAGANLARWRHPRWTVFGNGFYEATTIHGLAGHLLTLGAHVQYQAVPARAGRVRWTGVAATAGVEYARWTVGAESTIVTHFTAQGPAERATVQLDSLGTLDVRATTVAIPVEVTTGARLGVFALYGGGGLSLAVGEAVIEAQLDSMLSINADNLPIGTAMISGSGENTPSPLAAYALAGAAVHTRHARVFLQAAFAPGELAASLGLRVVM